MRAPLIGIAVLSSMILNTIAARAIAQPPQRMPLGRAWAANSVNATVFRNDPITTHGQQQYAAYYDARGRVVIATRTIGQNQWRPTVTDLRGNVKDAHNVISIIADGEGYLHVAWDHHGNPLKYARSKTPNAIDLEQVAMTGVNEQNVTYPQFFKLADGSLIFFFRDGASGRGNLVLNHYDTKNRAWTRLHANLISGEDRRSAYPQACVDARGSIHVSWVWRETGDVETNHDLCYARSDDGGKSWKKSDGTAYAIPITAANAQVAADIPQKHELINQTSMCADDQGRPIIATYFRPPGTKVVQYFLIWHDGTAWKRTQVTQRKTPFTLSGGGSKQIPISRPQVLARTASGKPRVWMIFRDAERDNRVSVAHCADLSAPQWSITDLTDFAVRYWEPAYDHVRWDRDGVLNLFVQVVGQGDAETLEAVPPQSAQVLEWKP